MFRGTYLVKTHLPNFHCIFLSFCLPLNVTGVAQPNYTSMTKRNNTEPRIAYIIAGVLLNLVTSMVTAIDYMYLLQR